MRQFIQTQNAPAAIGPYSQAVQVDNALYLSGQLGIDPNTGKLVEGGVTAQAAQAFKNIQAILTAAGFTMADVVQVQVFLTSIGDFSAVNSVYQEYVKPPYPARAAFAVAALPANGAVEILAVAIKK